MHNSSGRSSNNTAKEYISALFAKKCVVVNPHSVSVRVCSRNSPCVSLRGSWSLRRTGQVAFKTHNMHQKVPACGVTDAGARLSGECLRIACRHEDQSGRGREGGVAGYRVWGHK